MLDACNFISLVYRSTFFWIEYKKKEIVIPQKWTSTINGLLFWLFLWSECRWQARNLLSNWSFSNFVCFIESLAWHGHWLVISRIFWVFYEVPCNSCCKAKCDILMVYFSCYYLYYISCSTHNILWRGDEIMLFMLK